MAAVKTLAQGKTKVALLTTAPANPAAPTVTELTAGKDISCDILTSDFNWTAADSATFTETELCAADEQTHFAAGTYNLGLTLFRKFDATTGAGDPVTELAWEALAEKGTEVYIYVRETGKESGEAWAATDEIYLGGLVRTDTPQKIDGSGFIKRRIPLSGQRMYNNIVVAAGA